MVRPSLADASNQLLNLLPNPSTDFVSALETVELRTGKALVEPDQEIDYVYFPIDALISILCLGSDGTTVETGLVGRQGMIGLPAVLGGVTPHRAVVQTNGQAARVKVEALLDEFQKNESVRNVLLTYTNAFLVQTAQLSICNCFHSLQERLCRWLLVACDGINSNSISITHDNLARLLGARRASITVAIGLLQKAGLVATRRGCIIPLDAKALEEVACDCYGILKESLRFEDLDG